jgi:hypothetical protein
MRDDLSDFEGTLQECAELQAAQESVRDWLKRRMLDPEVLPGKKGDSQGIYEKHQVVRPSPSAQAARHKAPKLHQCRDCELMIGGTAWRCPEHRRAHRLAKQGAAQHRIYMRNKKAAAATA